MLPYFKHKELACRATGRVQLADGFAEQLVALRKKWGNPMIVTSCCRSKDHNSKVGGSPRSFHVYDHPYYNTGGTCAIDISCTNSATRGQLIHLAWQEGWSIGVNKTFIHLDYRTLYTNLKQSLFLYN